jgi:hypothetical protein
MKKYMGYTYVTISWFQRLHPKKRQIKKTGLSTTSAMANPTMKSYYLLYEQDMVELVRSETDGKSAINPTIVML